MHFQTIANVVVLMTATLSSGMIVPDLPDGLWKSEQLSNGTTITTCLNDPTLPPFITHSDAPVPRRERVKRGSGTGGCWGYFLDHASVDNGNQRLQNEFSNGATYCSGSSNTWTGWVTNGVLVYFCNDEPNECANLNPGVIQQGMGLMDAICQPYEAGWALYPGGPGTERFIMGKCASDANICV